MICLSRGSPSASSLYICVYQKQCLRYVPSPEAGVGHASNKDLKKIKARVYMDNPYKRETVKTKKEKKRKKREVSRGAVRSVASFYAAVRIVAGSHPILVIV